MLNLTQYSQQSFRTEWNFNRPYMSKLGRCFRIRPLSITDKEKTAGFLRRLSVETLRLRFMASINRLSDDGIRQELTRLYKADPECEVVMVVTVIEGNNEEIIGLGELRKHLVYPARGELALLVRDDYQCEGIGSALMETLKAEMQNRGYKSWEVLTMAKNYAIRHLIRKLGEIIDVEYWGDEVFYSGSFDF